MLDKWKRECHGWASLHIYKSDYHKTSNQFTWLYCVFYLLVRCNICCHDYYCNRIYWHCSSSFYAMMAHWTFSAIRWAIIVARQLQSCGVFTQTFLPEQTRLTILFEAGKHEYWPIKDDRFFFFILNADLIGTATTIIIKATTKNNDWKAIDTDDRLIHSWWSQLHANKWLN